MPVTPDAHSDDPSPRKPIRSKRFLSRGLSKVEFRWPIQGSLTTPTSCGLRGSWPDPGPREFRPHTAGFAATSFPTALHTVAHPCAVNRSCRAVSALAQVDEHFMTGRRGSQL
ncbi:hypothetical protein MTO96_028840 [Rhipicephalus appendiculatus]